VVILGGGFGGTYTFKHLHKHFHKDKAVELKLVSDRNYFLFTPLLHEAATGGVLPHQVVEPLRKVLSCCLNDFYLARAKRVNTKRQTVYTSRGAIKYDFLVIALGSQPNFRRTRGAGQNAFTLKSLEDAQKLKRHFIRTFEEADKTKDKSARRRLLSFVIVGGGPTGVEIAAEMSEFFRRTMRLRHVHADAVNIFLVQRQKELLPQFSRFIREVSRANLDKLDVKVFLGASVVSISGNKVKLDNGEQLESSTAIWVGGVKPVGLRFDRSLAMAKSGKIVVNKYLQVEGHRNIFALGDVASFVDGKSGEEAPALAQVAVRQAPVVAENIKQLIKGGRLGQYQYKNQGYLLSLGKWMGVGEIFGFSVKGWWVWWIYRTVYLSKLLSWQKRVYVALDWTVNLFSPRDTSDV